jgi:hypothetical protein
MQPTWKAITWFVLTVDCDTSEWENDNIVQDVLVPRAMNPQPLTEEWSMSMQKLFTDSWTHFGKVTTQICSLKLLQLHPFKLPSQYTMPFTPA